MDTIDNLQNRAKEIRGAFLPESVSNEAVGSLLLDVINFIVNYSGSGEGGGAVNKKYWSKEELQVLDQYLYALGEKVKAIYADEAGNADTWDGAHLLDYLNQPVKTDSAVEFRSVMAELFRTPGFIAGLTGVGTGMPNQNEFHTDKLVIRKTLEVLALVVAKMYWRGGRNVNSPAGIKVSRVEEFPEFYRLFMITDDGQTNDFTVGAQARCNEYGDNRQKYYWRLVTGLGTDYIDLSKTDKDGEGIPEVGDDVVQFGHRTDPYLRWVVMESSYPDDAGTTIYANVDSYDLTDKIALRLGVDPKNQSRIGLFTRSGEFSDVVDGLGQDIQDAQSSASDADQKAQEIRNYIDNALRTELDGLHDQADGLVERWPGSYIPLPNNENPNATPNYPADQWLTDKEKQDHVDDTFTKDSGSGEYLGNSWKWSRVANIWQWVLISDTALTAALAQSARAEETAKRKTRNFIVTPYPPYEAGDTWSQGSGGDYMRCVVSRLSGNFASPDWEKASKYTDDTRANEALTRMANMAEDGILTKEEKAKTRQEMATLEKEYASLVTRATSYGLAHSGLTAAKNAFVSYLTGTAKVNDNTDTNISVSDYSTKEAGYKVEVQLISDLIAKKVADGAVANIQIGSRNLLLDSGRLINSGNYNTAVYTASVDLIAGKRYTLVLRGTTTGGQFLGAYMNGGNSILTQFKPNMTDEINSSTFTAKVSLAPDYNRVICIFNVPNTGSASNPATIKWAALYEGEVKPPMDWTAAPEDLRIGVRNLILKSNVGASGTGYPFKTYDVSIPIVVGKTYTAVINGRSTAPNGIYMDIGSGQDIAILKSATDITVSNTFIAITTGNIQLYHHPDNSSGSSTVNWVMLFESNKAPETWIAAPEDIQAGIDNIQIGTVNLISRKIMLAWNDLNAGISTWGQDSDGIYIEINSRKIDGYAGTGMSSAVNDFKDCFDGKIKYKSNTQYCFSVREKFTGASYGINFIVVYTDGTRQQGERVGERAFQKIAFVTDVGKTVQKIVIYVATYAYNNRIYDIGLIEGNKIPTEIPLANEDQAGASNVNLLDNSNFRFGTKGYTINQAATLNLVNGVLQVRTSQTTSTPGIILPTVFLKAGVYSFKTRMAGVNIRRCAITLYTSNLSISIYGYYINTETSVLLDQNVIFAVPSDGEYKVLISTDASSAATQPHGFNITHSMLVSGFLAPDSFNLSQGDVQADIDDVTTAVGKLRDFTDTAFSDGVISRSEAKAIASNIGVLNSEKSDIDGGYGVIWGNQYLHDSDQEAINFRTAKYAYNSAHSALINSINTAIADGKTTPTEKADVDGKFSLYHTALYNYKIAQEGATKKIQDRMKSIATSDAVSGSQEGKMLYKDANFSEGANGIYGYYGSNVIVTRVARPADCPSPTHCLEIKTIGAHEGPGMGGFYFANPSRANAVFIAKIVAKIPVGYSINFSSNSIGSGEKVGWLTPVAGTGKYETYIHKTTCGATGNFSTTNFFYLSGSTTYPVIWYVAYATVIDQTLKDDVEDITKDSFAKEMGYASFQDLITKASADGKLVVNGILNAKLIDVDTLIVKQGFVDKLNGFSFNFTTGKVGGFTIEDYLQYSGAKPGAGDGICIQNYTTEKMFSVYKGTGNFVKMFNKNDGTWGLQGMKDGKTIFQLGSDNTIGGFEFSSGRIGKGVDVDGSGYGMALYENFIRFRDANYFAAIGCGTFQSSGGRAVAARFEVNKSRSYTDAPDNIGLYLFATGCPEIYTDVGKNIALDIDKGHLRINNGVIIYRIKTVGYTTSVIPVRDTSILRVEGSTGSDNPITLGAGFDGQRLTVINANKSHRLNVTNTTMGGAWVLDGSSATFTYSNKDGGWVEPTDYT